MKDKFKIFGLLLCITATLTMAVSCQKDELGGPTSTYTKDGNNGQIQTPTPDSLVGTVWEYIGRIDKMEGLIITFISPSVCTSKLWWPNEDNSLNVYNNTFTYEYNSPYGRMISSNGSICDFKVEGNRMFLSHDNEFFFLIRQ
ncbi:MAG: hypothetical protein J6X35_01330 [Bacteroidales bacterium]|nr:hypothetical protein [Bacteroidales bacterium]